MTLEAPHDAVRDLDEFRVEARRWLSQHHEPRAQVSDSAAWGEGSDDVSVFLHLDEDVERRQIEAAQAWQQRKWDAGYVAISWPTEHGGRGLAAEFAQAFAAEEEGFAVPSAGELTVTTVGLIAPTIAALGTAEQQTRFVTPLLRMEELAVQLFSEPEAGSDLAGVTTRAERHGDVWVLNGQKVWTSGARYAAWGLAICRHDPTQPKHRGLTAFLVPLDAPGVEIRPLRQMTGAQCFNEVFLTDVQVGDALRISDVGAGWSVAMACLGFERDYATGGNAQFIGGSFDQVVSAAREFGRLDDPVVRDTLADLYVHTRIEAITNLRIAAQLGHSTERGPELSLSRLRWVANLGRIADAITVVLGPRVTADTGEWGTYAWIEHILGAPGYRIAGGTEEIQRNIIGERVLGLPREPPGFDREAPFSTPRPA